ncbi:MAG TPA: hypothetical protein DEV64_04545 [Rhodospirillaceae bacterium]|nr:hypothetical protein [Rhodospirillaceae bacterium]
MAPARTPGGEGAFVHNDLFRRANASTAAGADCVLVLGKMRLETIRRIARDIDGLPNIIGSAARPSVTALGAAGVRHDRVRAIPARSVSPASSFPKPGLTTR